MERFVPEGRVFFVSGPLNRKQKQSSSSAIPAGSRDRVVVMATFYNQQQRRAGERFYIGFDAPLL